MPCCATCESTLALATCSALVFAVPVYGTYIHVVGRIVFKLASTASTRLLQSSGFVRRRCCKLSCFQWSSPPVHCCSNSCSAVSIFSKRAFHCHSNELVTGSLSLEFPDFCETRSNSKFSRYGAATGPVPQLSICSWLSSFASPFVRLDVFHCSFLVASLVPDVVLSD